MTVQRILITLPVLKAQASNTNRSWLVGLATVKHTESNSKRGKKLGRSFVRHKKAQISMENKEVYFRT